MTAKRKSSQRKTIDHTTVDEKMLRFSNSIHELPASLEPPTHFVSKWESLLD